MSDLASLIARIEQAEGPNFELEREIAIAVGRVPLGFEHADRWPAYTASLDAALTLVPEGEDRWPQAEYIGPNPNNKANGHRWRLWLGSARSVRGESQHGSAMALCAAALRARETSQ